MRLFFAIVLTLSLSACARVGQTATAQSPAGKPGQVTNFDECVEAGYATTKSLPQRCTTPNGQQFTKQRVKPEGPGGCENKCGDGVCQQIVCMAVGCPCAENPVNCAADCASSAF